MATEAVGVQREGQQGSPILHGSVLSQARSTASSGPVPHEGGAGKQWASQIPASSDVL